MDTEYSVRMQENTEQKKLRIWTLFTQCGLCKVALRLSLCHSKRIAHLTPKRIVKNIHLCLKHQLCEPCFPYPCALFSTTSVIVLIPRNA